MARSGLRRLTWISIHAPREGCDACPVTWSAAQRRISIHAPREGCDGRQPDDVHLLLISIHAPREGCDWVKARRAAYFTEFQSTHPARGATSWAELDAEAQEFQSTHPARGATLHRRYPRHVKEISIHAPREGCDISRRSVADDKQNFNPRTPRGVRQPSCLQNSLPRRFQSTHPARGATLGEQQGCPQHAISIHAPRGCDKQGGLVFQQAKISIHAPREGATWMSIVHMAQPLKISIHAPREESFPPVS